MNNHNEMIAVIAAHRDGKQIQFRFLKPMALSSIPPQWVDSENPEHPFNFSAAEYRIKPEPPKPREWWISDCINGEPKLRVFPAEPGKCSKCEIIHVREVLP